MMAGAAGNARSRAGDAAFPTEKGFLAVVVEEFILGIFFFFWGDVFRNYSNIFINT